MIGIEIYPKRQLWSTGEAERVFLFQPPRHHVKLYSYLAIIHHGGTHYEVKDWSQNSVVEQRARNLPFSSSSLSIFKRTDTVYSLQTCLAAVDGQAIQLCLECCSSAFSLEGSKVLLVRATKPAQVMCNFAQASAPSP